MHVPPYHKQKSWQRFLVGGFIGAIIAYIIFVYMHGTMYEKLYEENVHLKSEITELKNQNEALLQDKKDLDEKQNEETTVEDIELHIANKDELEMDRLLVHQLEEEIQETLEDVIGQEVRLVGASNRLLISTLEKQTYSVDEVTYQFRVTQLIISENVQLTLEGHIEE